MRNICFINLIFINGIFFINCSNDLKSSESDGEESYVSEDVLNTAMKRNFKLPEIHISTNKNISEKNKMVEPKKIEILVLPRINNDRKINENIQLYHSIKQRILKLIEKYKYLKDYIQHTATNYFTSHPKYYNRSWAMLYNIRYRIGLIVKFYKSIKENYNITQLEICKSMVNSCCIDMNIFEQTLLKIVE